MNRRDQQMNRREFLGTAAAVPAAAVFPLSILPESKTEPEPLLAGCQGTDDPICWELHLNYNLNYKGYCVIYGYRDFHELCNKIMDLATGTGPESRGKIITFGGEAIRIAQRAGCPAIDPQELCLVIYEGEYPNNEARLPYSWGGEWMDLDVAFWRARIRAYASGDHHIAKALANLDGPLPRGRGDRLAPLQDITMGYK